MLECPACCCVGGRESEADMAIWADQDHAARSEAGALVSDIWIVRDLHALCPPTAKLCQPFGVRGGSKNKHVMRRPAQPCPVWVALPGMRLRQATPVFRIVIDERATFCSRFVGRKSRPVVRLALG